jgi:glutamate 5-kinase
MAYQRIVAKFGTALLTNGSDNLDKGIMSRLVAQLAKLHEQGRELIIVSSGAMAAGRHRLGLSKRVREIPFKQVLASVGQHRLVGLYEQLFEDHNITVAQALLARSDLLDRAGYLNARNTLMALL